MASNPGGYQPYGVAGTNAYPSTANGMYNQYYAAAQPMPLAQAQSQQAQAAMPGPTAPPVGYPPAPAAAVHPPYATYAAQGSPSAPYQAPPPPQTSVPPAVPRTDYYAAQQQYAPPTQQPQQQVQPWQNVNAAAVAAPLPSSTAGNVSQQPSQHPHPHPHPQQQQQLQRQAEPSYARKTRAHAVKVSDLTPIYTQLYPEVLPRYSTSSNDPPYAATGFIAIDDGNASPKFFLPTTNAIPTESKTFQETRLPFGAVLSPLHRPLQDAVEEVPLIAGQPPVRCHRCRGYLSCHAKFIESGRQWVCPLCEMVNEVEEGYFCNLDSHGRRLDREERPELCRGSVEYDVDAYTEYALRSEKDEVVPTRPLHHIFLIDVSRQAEQSFLPQYITGLREALHRMAETCPECRVSFITFAKQLHFYNFRHPRMPQFCVGDVDNPFVPLPFNRLSWLVVGAELAKIDLFLDHLQEVAQDLGETGCVLGAAVKAALLVLAGQHGGRVTMCAHDCPRAGLGAVGARAQRLPLSAAQEKEFLRPMDGFWTTTATEAARQQICCDLFLFAHDYCELVTLSQLCHVTNGKVVYFANYRPEVDQRKLEAALALLATEEMGYAGILRVRCSPSMRVQRYHGHFLSQNVNDMDLAGIAGSSTFYVEFAHEGKLEENSTAYFQVALLYTTRSGHRRVRVQSVALGTAATFKGTFATANVESVLYGWLHAALSEVVNKGYQKARDGLVSAVEQDIASYTVMCVGKYAGNVMQLPTRLKLLPVYCLCLLHSNVLRLQNAGRIDDRVRDIFALLTLPLPKLLDFLYPTLYSLHKLHDNASFGTINAQTGRCVMPPRGRLLYTTVTTDCVFALCDEQAEVVYLWIGSAVPAAVAQSLFHTDNASYVCREGGPGEAEFDERLRNVLTELVLREDGMRRLVVVHHGDRLEDDFFAQFREDAEVDGQSYEALFKRIYNIVKERMSYEQSYASRGVSAQMYPTQYY